MHIPANLVIKGYLIAPRSEGTTQGHETKSQHGVPIDLKINSIPLLVLVCHNNSVPLWVPYSLRYLKVYGRRCCGAPLDIWGA